MTARKTSAEKAADNAVSDAKAAKANDEMTPAEATRDAANGAIDANDNNAETTGDVRDALENATPVEGGSDRDAEFKSTDEIREGLKADRDEVIASKDDADNGDADRFNAERAAADKRAEDEPLKADSHHVPNHAGLNPETRDLLKVRAGFPDSAVPAVLADLDGHRTAQTNPELDIPALDDDGADAAERSKRDGKKHF